MENYKFEGQGQFIDILSQLDINKTLLIQITVFIFVFLIAKSVFLKRYAFILAKRLEGTSHSKGIRDEALNKLDALKSQYDNKIKNFQIKMNEEIHQTSSLAHKEFDRKTFELKEKLLNELDIYKKKSEDESKNMLDDSVSSIIELKDKLVNKILA